MTHEPNCPCPACKGLRDLVKFNSSFIEDAIASDPHDITKCRCQDCRAVIAALAKQVKNGS